MKNEQLKTALISALAVIIILLLVLKKLPSEQLSSETTQTEDSVASSTDESNEGDSKESIKTASEGTLPSEVINEDGYQCVDLQETVDSLKTLLTNHQENSPNDRKLTKEERMLEETIIELNKGYAKMSETKDVQEVLKHFLPHFASNVINIGVDETVFVDRRGSKSYSNRLEDLIQMQGLEIIMGTTKFLHLFIKGDVAIAIYLTEYETRIDGKTMIKGTVLGQATCKKYNGNEYKIGNYSLVNVRDYEIFATPTSTLQEKDL